MLPAATNAAPSVRNGRRCDEYWRARGVCVCVGAATVEEGSYVVGRMGSQGGLFVFVTVSLFWGQVF